MFITQRTSAPSKVCQVYRRIAHEALAHPVLFHLFVSVSATAVAIFVSNEAGGSFLHSLMIAAIWIAAIHGVVFRAR